MNIRIAVIAMLVIIGSASCHKRVCEDELGTPMVSANTWKYGSVSHSGATSGWTKPMNGAVLSFFASGSGPEFSSINFRFWNVPKTSGVYRIVREAAAADEVNIFTKEPSGPTYLSTGTDGAFATVTIKEGRMSVYCSKVKLEEEQAKVEVEGAFNLTEL